MSQTSCDKACNIVMPASDDIVYCIMTLGRRKDLVRITVNGKSQIAKFDSREIVKAWEYSSKMLKGEKLAAIAIRTSEYEELSMMEEGSKQEKDGDE